MRKQKWPKILDGLFYLFCIKDKNHEYVYYLFELASPNKFVMSYKVDTLKPKNGQNGHEMDRSGWQDQKC